jgi:hypothetical protein
MGRKLESCLQASLGKIMSSLGPTPILYCNISQCACDLGDSKGQVTVAWSAIVMSKLALGISVMDYDILDPVLPLYVLLVVCLFEYLCIYQLCKMSSISESVNYLSYPTILWID